MSIPSYLLLYHIILFLAVLTVGITQASVSDSEQQCELCVEVLDGYLLPGLTAKVDLTLTAPGESQLLYLAKVRVVQCEFWCHANMQKMIAIQNTQNVCLRVRLCLLLIGETPTISVILYCLLLRVALARASLWKPASIGSSPTMSDCRF